jgi:hypothetical protein
LEAAIFLGISQRKLISRTFSFQCKMRQDSQVREALDDIATLLATFFQDSDYVLSDIIAGLLLLVHSPHKRIPPSIDPLKKEADSSFPVWMKVYYSS